MKVFLSHSSLDKDLARRLAQDLRDAGVDVWLDQWELRVGEIFEQRIEQGLDAVDFVIVLLTPASVTSEWVRREWRTKVQHEAQTRRVSVVPVRGEACEIPDFLAQRSYSDISGGSYPLGFKHLLTILRYYSDSTDIGLSDHQEHGRAEEIIPIVTPIALEVGNDLIPLFEPRDGVATRAMRELAPRMRENLKTRLGFPFPGVRIRGNDTDMPPRQALIMIDEVPELTLEIAPDEVVANATVDDLTAIGISGIAYPDAVTNRVIARIEPEARSAAGAAGFETWDAAEYLFSVLERLLLREAPQLLDLDVVRGLVDAVEAVSPELASRVVPDVVSWMALTEVLIRLVEEGISIGDMPRILDALAGRSSDETHAVALTERVRRALNSQITEQFIRGRRRLPVLSLDPAIEALVRQAVQPTALGPFLNLSPENCGDILRAVQRANEALGSHQNDTPILVMDPAARPFVRRIVALQGEGLSVLSRQDLAPGVVVDIVGHIHLDPKQVSHE